jgi:predicted nucleic acid-binding protein
MAVRTFVDTNVLVYAYDASEPTKRAIAGRVLAQSVASELVLSAQVLGEFYVVVTRKLSPPLPERDAAAAVERLTTLAVVAIDADLVRNGVAISRSAQLSYWDGLIVAAAAAGGCERLLSEDLADGATIDSVRIENPFR